MGLNSTNKEQKEIWATLALWGVVEILLIFSLFFAPCSLIITLIFKSNIPFIFIYSLPGALVVFSIIGLVLNNHSLAIKNNINIILIALIFYCLIIVLLTGGITKSPLVPLVGIVPLMSGPFMKKSTHIKMLKYYLVGILLITLCSNSVYFNPPVEYPINGWTYAGEYDALIVMALLCITVILEIFLINIRRAP